MLERKLPSFMPPTRPFEPHDFRQLYADTDAGPPFKKLAGGGTLAQLSEDYALFTFAPLVMWGGLSTNPVREYMNEHGHESGVWLIPLTEALFDYGPKPIQRFWATKLWACERQIWDDPDKPNDGLCFTLGTIGIINRDAQQFSRVLCQDIPVPDVIAMRKTTVLPSPCPMVTITTFSLDSNKGVLAFEPAARPPIDRARVVYMEPLPETTALAEAVLCDAERPYDEAAWALWERENGIDAPSAALVRGGDQAGTATGHSGDSQVLP